MRVRQRAHQDHIKYSAYSRLPLSSDYVHFASKAVLGFLHIFQTLPCRFISRALPASMHNQPRYCACHQHPAPRHGVPDTSLCEQASAEVSASTASTLSHWGLLSSFELLAYLASTVQQRSGRNPSSFPTEPAVFSQVLIRAQVLTEPAVFSQVGGRRARC